jgi:3-methyladenine DNA glycosylase AlkD
MKEISKNIQNKITSIGKPDKANWLENYIKHNIKSKGVGIPEIRNIVKDVTKECKLLEFDITEQIDLLNDLMNSEYTEDKLAAIIYIQLNWNNKNEQKKIALISNWFDKELITDWNVCDWLCVRLLSPMIDNWTKETLIELKKWNISKNQWKARASLVAFAQCKSIDKYKGFIEDFSLELIKRNERFCKTAVGWVLREYSKKDADFVTKFLAENENWATKEVIKNAMKYVDN